MNNFKESLVVNIERKNSGEIIITEPLRKLLIEFMKKNGTDEDKEKKDLMMQTGIGDKGTVERLLEKIVKEDESLLPLYNDYISRKPENFNGYSFRAEAVDMLRKDYSQSFMAEKIGVNRRTFSTKIKKIQEENSENILGKLLSEHAERKMKRKDITLEEKVKINCVLNEYEEQFPLGKAIYEKRDILRIRLENLKRVIDTVDEIIAEDGITIKEVCARGIISESNYRKYKEEFRNLEEILNGRD